MSTIKNKETPQLLADRFFTAYPEEQCKNDGLKLSSTQYHERLVDTVTKRDTICDEETARLREGLEASERLNTKHVGHIERLEIDNEKLKENIYELEIAYKEKINTLSEKIKEYHNTLSQRLRDMKALDKAGVINKRIFQGFDFAVEQTESLLNNK